MSKLRKYKLLRIAIGAALGIFAFLLLASLYNFLQLPQYSTLFSVLFSLFGFFFALWCTLHDLGYFLNASQHKNLAKNDTFFLTENEEEESKRKTADMPDVDDYLIIDTTKLAKMPHTTDAATKEILDELHDFLDKREKKTTSSPTI